MELPENVRAFLEESHYCTMATINRDGTPQLTAMWYDLEGDTVILNMSRGLLKEKNLRRDPRMAICVVDGYRYATLEGRAEIVEDRALQEKEVNRLSIRYIGLRLGPQRWEVIKGGDRLGIHLTIDKWHARGL